MYLLYWAWVLVLHVEYTLAQSSSTELVPVIKEEVIFTIGDSLQEEVADEPVTFPSFSTGGDPACSVLSSDSCPFVPGIVIGVHEENLVHRCQELCQEDAQCSHFTLYRLTDKPLCYMFSECPYTVNCEDCTSGPKFPTVPQTCIPDCSVFSPGSCDTDLEYLSISSGVEDSQKCQNLCRLDSECSYFTHVSFFCYLFSNCSIKNVTECPGCLSGPEFPPVSLCNAAPKQEDQAFLIGGIGEDKFTLTSVDIENGRTGYGGSTGIEDVPPRSQAISEVFQNKVLLCGGTDDQVCRVSPGKDSSLDRDYIFNDCFLLDVEENEWKITERMRRGRKAASSVIINTSVLVMGGVFHRADFWDYESCSPGRLDTHQCGLHCQTHITDNVEEFDFQTETWDSYDAPLPIPLEGSCAVHVDGMVYVSGGVTYDKNVTVDSDTLFMLNTSSKEWTKLSHMYQNRAFHSCTFIRNNGREGLLILGGYSKEKNPYQGVLDSVEFFDFQTKRWESLWNVGLNIGRYGASLATIDGYPTVFGGHGEDGNTITKIERFVLGQWKISERELVNGRAFSSVVVLTTSSLAKLKASSPAYDLLPELPSTCEDVKLQDEMSENGMYFVNLTGTSTFVSCDFATDQSAWTLIQRRGQFGKKVDYFNVGKEAYVEGFGLPEEEYWLGLELIRRITNSGTFKLRIDMWDLDEGYSFAQYDSFKLGEGVEGDKHHVGYVLQLGDYSGNATDKLSSYKGAAFHVPAWRGVRHGYNYPTVGGWWHKGNPALSLCNLNGNNLKKVTTRNPNAGIFWVGASGHVNADYSMLSAEMKIKLNEDAVAEFRDVTVQTEAFETTTTSV